MVTYKLQYNCEENNWIRIDFYSRLYRERLIQNAQRYMYVCSSFGNVIERETRLRSPFVRRGTAPISETAQERKAPRLHIIREDKTAFAARKYISRDTREIPASIKISYLAAVQKCRRDSRLSSPPTFLPLASSSFYDALNARNSPKL